MIIAVITSVAGQWIFVSIPVILLLVMAVAGIIHDNSEGELHRKSGRVMWTAVVITFVGMLLLIGSSPNGFKECGGILLGIVLAVVEIFMAILGFIMGLVCLLIGC